MPLGLFLLLVIVFIIPHIVLVICYFCPLLSYAADTEFLFDIVDKKWKQIMFII